jgi:probable addiction module antidote protein
MTRTATPYRDSLLDALTDPREAEAYLNAALEDSQASFLKAVKNVAQAAQMTQVARKSGIQRETLYRALSENGNPTFATLCSVLDVLGLKLSVSAHSGSPKIGAASPAPSVDLADSGVKV